MLAISIMKCMSVVGIVTSLMSMTNEKTISGEMVVGFIIFLALFIITDYVSNLKRK